MLALLRTALSVRRRRADMDSKGTPCSARSRNCWSSARDHAFVTVPGATPAFGPMNRKDCISEISVGFLIKCFIVANVIGTGRCVAGAGGAIFYIADFNRQRSAPAPADDRVRSHGKTCAMLSSRSGSVRSFGRDCRFEPMTCFNVMCGT